MTAPRRSMHRISSTRATGSQGDEDVETRSRTCATARQPAPPWAGSSQGRQVQLQRPADVPMGPSLNPPVPSSGAPGSQPVMTFRPPGATPVSVAASASRAQPTEAAARSDARRAQTWRLEGRLHRRWRAPAGCGRHRHRLVSHAVGRRLALSSACPCWLRSASPPAGFSRSRSPFGLRADAATQLAKSVVVVRREAVLAEARCEVRVGHLAHFGRRREPRASELLGVLDRRDVRRACLARLRRLLLEGQVEAHRAVAVWVELTPCPSLARALSAPAKHKHTDTKGAHDRDEPAPVRPERDRPEVLRLARSLALFDCAPRRSPRSDRYHAASPCRP